MIRRHVDTVHVEGLRIQVPPEEARKSLGGGVDASNEELMLNPSKVIVEHLITHDAELSFVSKKANNRPLTFPIQELEMDHLGFDRVMPFHARLTNPVPLGEIDARGTLGPWIKSDPAETEVKGDYLLSNADLSTINGISGTLKSTGSFGGRITAIDVKGTTETPNFNLELGGRPLPLSTTFVAMVDGTNGTTVLRQVDARLRNSAVTVSGAITNLPGPGHHSVDLDLAISDGRIEDVLALLMESSRPMATGRLTMHSALHLPPGRTPVLIRIALNGRFGLSRTKFSDMLQNRVQEFSRRTQGKNAEDTITNIATNVRGQFGLSNGVMRLRDLSFQVPGATVALAGACNLKDRTLALEGTLRMDASVSKAVGGFKSFFLRAVDPFFRKRGVGTIIPIKVYGTIEAPEVGLNFRRRKSGDGPSRQP
jgi:hypothetical protein